MSAPLHFTKIHAPKASQNKTPNSGISSASLSPANRVSTLPKIKPRISSIFRMATSGAPNTTPEGAVLNREEKAKVN